MLKRQGDFLDFKAEKVRILTIHASKGLEFPLVFMAGCEAGFLPYMGNKISSEEEERRLFYVGVTRRKIGEKDGQMQLFKMQNKPEKALPQYLVCNVGLRIKMEKREMKKLKIVSLMLGILFFPVFCMAAIYMYVDKSGIVRFSNTPVSPKYKFFIKEKKEKKDEKEKLIGGIAFYDEIIGIAARHHDVDPSLVKAVVRAESAFNPKAISSKGAKGLMQLMPGTIQDMGVKDPFNPSENIMAGTKYLRMMLDNFEDDVDLALAAYNAGLFNVRRYDGVPPFPETRNYIQKVQLFWEQYKK